ncbi:hypothetical protein HY404_03615 [Candidatus Microgenomates bacterium]|nr:hypothetical protein [Candidatus Microgenomates bacterium]
MHAYLVTGNNSGLINKEIDELLRIHQVALTYLQTLTSETNYGIREIRDINKSLAIQLTKKGEFRALVIRDAQLMTTEAQNAFLKTLEEPPSDTIIILTASQGEALLETIVSRCLVINTISQSPDINLAEQAKIYEELAKSDMGERVRMAETIGKNREEALQFVEAQLSFLHHMLHEDTLQANTRPHLFQQLLQSQQDLTHNVNPKMVLFELFRAY